MEPLLEPLLDPVKPKGNSPSVFAVKFLCKTIRASETITTSKIIQNF